MAFVTVISLPSFVHIKWCTSPSLILRHQLPVPLLNPRQVPLSQWALQVLVLTAGSLLNNWAFAFHVPLSVQIVFRSAGKLFVLALHARILLRIIVKYRPRSVHALWSPYSQETVFIITDSKHYL